MNNEPKTGYPYRGRVIDVVPVTKYVLVIDGKKVERGCTQISGYGIESNDKLVERGRELLDELARGEVRIKEGANYIQFVRVDK
jgi:hypothetical protein